MTEKIKPVEDTFDRTVPLWLEIFRCEIEIESLQAKVDSGSHDWPELTDQISDLDSYVTVLKMQIDKIEFAEQPTSRRGGIAIKMRDYILGKHGR